MNQKYGKIINQSLTIYNGEKVMIQDDGCVKEIIFINAQDGVLRNFGYVPIVEDVIPQLRYNQRLALYHDDLGMFIHISYDIITIDIDKNEIDAMKRQAYESESDHLYMQYQKYLATGDDRAEQTKIDWLAKVAEIQERYS